MPLRQRALLIASTLALSRTASQGGMLRTCCSVQVRRWTMLGRRAGRLEGGEAARGWEGKHLERAHFAWVQQAGELRTHVGEEHVQLLAQNARRLERALEVGRVDPAVCTSNRRRPPSVRTNPAEKQLVLVGRSEETDPSPRKREMSGGRTSAGRPAAPPGCSQLNPSSAVGPCP